MLNVTQRHVCKSGSVQTYVFHSEHDLQYVASVISIFSDMVSYVKSCILRRVRKLKSHEVAHRFEETCGKLGEKYGVMC